MAEQHQERGSTTLPGQFSLFSLGVFTMIVAALGLSAGYFYRALGGDSTAMGYFVLITAMAPLVLLLAVGLLFQILRLFLK